MVTDRPQMVTDRPQTNGNRPTGRCDCTNWSHADQGRNRPSDANKRQNPELLSEGNDARAGHSRVAASMATAFEPLNRSLKSFLTRLPVNAARGPGEYLRNRDVIKTNLTAV